MGLIEATLEKSAFDQPTDPVSSQGARRYARDVDHFVENMLNGIQEFGRMTYTAATELTISAGAITTSLALHTVKSESGTSDFLDSITAANGKYVALKAKTSHTIVIEHAASNISIPGGQNFTLSGNIIGLLYCQGGQWSLIGATKPLNNSNATSDPGSANDASAGYSVGSVWVNLTLDRAWICVDATTTTAIWKLISPWLNSWVVKVGDTANPQNIGLQSGGISQAVTGTGAASAITNDSNDTFILLTAGNNGDAHWIANTFFNHARLAHTPIFEHTLKTGADISSQRIWVGLGSANVTNVDTLVAGTKFVGFRYSTAKPDTGWTPVTNDGTNQTEGTTIGTVAVSTVYKFRIRVDSANARAYFSVNNSAEQLLSANFPAIATDVGLVSELFSLVAATRAYSLSRAEVGW